MMREKGQDRMHKFEENLFPKKTIKLTTRLRFNYDWPQLFKSWRALSTGSITIQWINIRETNCTIQWIEIHPVNNVNHLLNNLDLAYVLQS